MILLAGRHALQALDTLIDFHLKVKFVVGAHFGVVGLEDVHDAKFLLNRGFFIRNNRFIRD